MVGKKSGRALLREEGNVSHIVLARLEDREKPAAGNRYANDQAGLQRTDNNMDLTSWPQVGMINQKNYYTWVARNPQCNVCPG